MHPASLANEANLMTEALLLSLLAGLAMVAGGLFAALEHIRPDWLEQEFRNTVIAYTEYRRRVPMFVPGSRFHP